MFERIEIDDCVVTRPVADPKSLVELTTKVLALNERIVRINERIVDALTCADDRQQHTNSVVDQG